MQDCLYQVKVENYPESYKCFRTETDYKNYIAEKKSIKSDLDEISANYKAYILVGVLIVALFWFLRKAASE